MPVKTKIAPQAEIALLNSVTSLFLNGGGTLTVKYPNGREALYYRGETSIVEKAEPQAKSVPSATPVIPSDLPVEVSAQAGARNLNGDTVSREFVSVSASGANSKLFFLLAAGLSLLTAVGFLFLRNSRWIKQKF